MSSAKQSATLPLLPRQATGNDAAIATLRDDPPATLAHAVLLSVAALAALLLLWAALAKLDIVASAEGRLVPRGYTKLVQPAQAGVVSAILVKDGDSVREGQVLLRLDARLASADTRAAESESALHRMTLRRVEAELAERPFVQRSGEPSDLFAQVHAQWLARRQSLQGTLAQENESLHRARADLRAAEQTRAKLTQTLPLARQAAEAYRKLVAEGFVGELAASDRLRDVIEKERDLDAQTAAVAGLQAATLHASARIANVRSQYRSQLEGERMETVMHVNRQAQELDKARTRATMLEIRAPHDGVVKDLAVTAPGAVVEAAAVLMNVVPVDEPLQAEVTLRNDDVGFVAIGQPVKLKVAAYPFQKHGLLEGRVALVSADATLPRGNEQQPLTYRAQVQLSSSHLDSPAGDARLALSPGMAVVAEIHQGRRTVLEYLLSPLKKVAQEAARER